MPLIYEKLAPGQPAFTAETQQGDYAIEYPLGAAEPTALIIRARYMQYRANYARPAADTPLTYGAQTAYFVDDTDFTDERGGLTSWTRTWATLPATWSEDSELAFPYPAFQGTPSLGNSFPVTALAANTFARPITYTLTTTATGISAGDQVYVDINYLIADSSGSQNVHTAGTYPVKAATPGTNIVLSALATYGLSYGGVTGTVRKVGTSLGRTSPTTEPVDARIQHDYALTSVANIANVLPAIDRFRPILASNPAVEVTYLTSATLPSVATYESMVTAGTEIVAQRSTRRIYAGNIHERQTTYVVAR